MARRSVLLVYFFQIFFVSLLSLTQTGLGFPVSQAVAFLSWHSSSPLLFLADSGQLSGISFPGMLPPGHGVGSTRADTNLP